MTNTANTGTTPASFDQLGLSPVALQAVRALGYDAPTPVQAQAIPQVLQGRDVMAAAQTGTGKTAAFLLPTLDRLGHVGKGDNRGRGPLMLVVTPTRELAQQIEETARVICAQTRHSCTVVVGGVGYEPQREALRRGCDLLVATPGRLIDLMNQGDANLSQVEVLVLDEADRMLDMGFLPAMRKIVAKTPASRQTLLFSATLDDNVLDNTKSLVKDPARVEIAHKGTAAQTIDQYVLGVSAQAKVSVLAEVLRREGPRRVIVFCRGKHRCNMICRKLRKYDIECAPIHGNRSQNQREAALRRFASGEVDVLVATDVLARGIDIADVAYVVNLDVPSDAEDYIHRIGRTGRAGEYGWALTFVTDDEYLDLRDIEQLMGKVIPDYPRAEGIDLGPDAFVLDPTRDPKEKLPGKRMRKKLQQDRERAREKAAAAAGRTVERDERDDEEPRGRRGGQGGQSGREGRGPRADRDDRPARQQRPARPASSARDEERDRPARQGGHTRGGRGAGRSAVRGSASVTERESRGEQRAAHPSSRPARGGQGSRGGQGHFYDQFTSHSGRGRGRGEGRGQGYASHEGRDGGRSAGAYTSDGRPRRRPGDHGGFAARGDARR